MTTASSQHERTAQHWREPLASAIRASGARGAVCMYLVLVASQHEGAQGAHDGPPPTVWAPVYAPVLCSYLHCLAFWLCVHSSGESCFRTPHVRTAMRTLMYGHLMSVGVMAFRACLAAPAGRHAQDAHCAGTFCVPHRATAVLAHAGVVEAHSSLAKGIDATRFRSPGARQTAHWAASIVSLLALSGLQHATTGVSLHTYLAPSAYFTALLQPCVAAAFVLPPLLGASADVLALAVGLVVFDAPL